MARGRRDVEGAPGAHRRRIHALDGQRRSPGSPSGAADAWSGRLLLRRGYSGGARNCVCLHADAWTIPGRFVPDIASMEMSPVCRRGFHCPAIRGPPPPKGRRVQQKSSQAYRRTTTRAGAGPARILPQPRRTALQQRRRRNGRRRRSLPPAPRRQRGEVRTLRSPRQAHQQPTPLPMPLARLRNRQQPLRPLWLRLGPVRSAGRQPERTGRS